MININIGRLRTFMHRLREVLWMRYWFPHVPLGLLMAFGGILLLQSDLGNSWRRYLLQISSGSLNMPPRLLPPVLIGGGMLTMALGLLRRSRLAWNMALLLVVAAAVSTLFTGHHKGYLLLIYFLLVLSALLISWRHFDRASVAASTLFAFTSVAMLLAYATFGSYYLGTQFKPQISDLVTALYYSMVTMSTVGYGDIVPQTSEAKLFAVSIIVLGVAVFATSLTAVIAPLVSNSLQHIITRKGKGMKRENHFVVVGNTALATNTWRELVKRGRSVTRVLRKTPDDDEPGDVDVVIGDPGNVNVLRQAGVEHAEAVLAMLDDDSENAFVVLAVRELGSHARTIAAVNDAHHLERIKLVQPDVVIAPQVLGGELTAMLLTGEEVAPDFILQRVFQDKTRTPGGATTTSSKTTG